MRFVIERCHPLALGGRRTSGGQSPQPERPSWCGVRRPRGGTNAFGGHDSSFNMRPS